MSCQHAQAYGMDDQNKNLSLRDIAYPHKSGVCASRRLRYL